MANEISRLLLLLQLPTIPQNDRLDKGYLLCLPNCFLNPLEKCLKCILKRSAMYGIVHQKLSNQFLGLYRQTCFLYTVQTIYLSIFITGPFSNQFCQLYTFCWMSDQNRFFVYEQPFNFQRPVFTLYTLYRLYTFSNQFYPLYTFCSMSEQDHITSVSL